MGLQSSGLLRACQRVVTPIPRPVLDHAEQGPRPEPPQVLRRPFSARRQTSLQAIPSAAAKDRMGRLQQEPLRRARAGLALSIPLYPPRRHLQSSSGCDRRQRRRLALEGLAHRRTRTLEDNDPAPPRVYPAFPLPRAAQRLPPHPLGKRKKCPVLLGFCDGVIIRPNLNPAPLTRFAAKRF